jgi:hypothetical protein|tara:strand:+ start:6 stop:710 length:705 start_codon:yes stop_codon:yes gene_type:complete
MAINVNTVYQTVLLILNKEQRGYITPDEFNKTATQVQLQIFQKYFEDLNQASRVPQNDMDYADRVLGIDEKISLFRRTRIVATSNDIGSDVYRLGTVTFRPETLGKVGDAVELQRVQRNEYYNITKSPLTKPTEQFPVYLFQNNEILARPTTINSVDIDFVIRPSDVVWGFTKDQNTQILVYNSNTSTNFQLDQTEQTEVILRILAYAGIVIRDPQIVQAASQAVQAENINAKS